MDLRNNSPTQPAGVEDLLSSLPMASSATSSRSSLPKRLRAPPCSLAAGATSSPASTPYRSSKRRAPAVGAPQATTTITARTGTRPATPSSSASSTPPSPAAGGAAAASTRGCAPSVSNSTRSTTRSLATWTRGSPSPCDPAAPWRSTSTLDGRSSAPAPDNFAIIITTVRTVMKIGELKDESGGDGDEDFRNPNTRDRAYRVPRELFSSSAASVRTLCLGSCFLDLPPEDTSFHLNLPSVETLALIWIPDSGRDIQRLVSACPRLTELTLDSRRRLRAVSILDKRLRKLSLWCCHGTRLTVDATELRALEYKGPVPDDSVVNFVGSPPTIVSCDVEFCGRTNPFAEPSFAPTVEEPKNLPWFLGRLSANARWLRWGSFACMGSGIEKSKFSLPLFLCLRQLEVKGTLTSNSAAEAVTRILEATPNLEILTLLILPDVDERPRRDAVSYDPKAVLHVPDVLPIIPCLRDRLREINVVHYQGRVPQRSLLKQLLLNASAREEMYVVFPKGKYVAQTFLMGEIQSWVVNLPLLKVMFA